MVLTYPSRADERIILDRMGTVDPDLTVEPVLAPAELAEVRHTVDQLYVDEKIKGYILDIVESTRHPAEFGLELAGYLQCGASPRATIFLLRAAKAQAFLDGRGYVTPQDVKAVAPDVLRHRLLLTYEAEAEELRPETLVQRILDQIKVP